MYIKLIYSCPCFLSFMPTSPCPTMWASPACSLSWSMRMITGPSSANRCTTSAFQKTQFLVLHCSASWWVPSNTGTGFVEIYFPTFQIKTPISHSLLLGLFYCGCIPNLFVVVQCQYFFIIQTQDSLPPKKVCQCQKCSLVLKYFLLPVVTAHFSDCKDVFFHHVSLTVLLLWKCPNDIFVVSILYIFLSCYP